MRISPYIPSWPVGPTKTWSQPQSVELDRTAKYTATIATSDGLLGVELLPDLAPNAVKNFAFLAKQGFYDHVPIHRMIPGFMMQSGDPTGTGTGGPGYAVPDDPIPASTTYTTGVLAMANSGGPGTQGSQFFVMLGDTPMPPNYTVFGKVTSGLDTLAKVNARPVVDNGMGEQSKPVDPISVDGVWIFEDGQWYDERPPETRRR